MARKTGKNKTLRPKKSKSYAQATPLLQLVVMRETVKRKNPTRKPPKKARAKIRLVYWR